CDHELTSLVPSLDQSLMVPSTSALARPPSFRATKEDTLESCEPISRAPELALGQSVILRSVPPLTSWPSESTTRQQSESIWPRCRTSGSPVPSSRQTSISPSSPALATRLSGSTAIFTPPGPREWTTCSSTPSLDQAVILPS